ncbi:MAG: hypothetical protein K0R41_3386 [Geminicoccaceae bacterium]|nr:hypothetical protein [Geminicoccaceae bacterium]
MIYLARFSPDGRRSRENPDPRSELRPGTHRSRQVYCRVRRHADGARARGARRHRAPLLSGVAGRTRPCRLALSARNDRWDRGLALPLVGAARAVAGQAHPAPLVLRPQQLSADPLARRDLAPGRGLGGGADQLRGADGAARRADRRCRRMPARPGSRARGGGRAAHAGRLKPLSQGGKRLWLAAAALRSGVDDLGADASRPRRARGRPGAALPVPELGRHRRDHAAREREPATPQARLRRRSGGRAVRRQHGREAGPRGARAGRRAPRRAAGYPVRAVRRGRGPTAARAPAGRPAQRDPAAAAAARALERPAQPRGHPHPAAARPGSELRAAVQARRDPRQRPSGGGADRRRRARPRRAGRRPGGGAGRPRLDGRRDPGALRRRRAPAPPRPRRPAVRRDLSRSRADHRALRRGLGRAPARNRASIALAAAAQQGRGAAVPISNSTSSTGRSSGCGRSASC